MSFILGGLLQGLGGGLSQVAAQKREDSLNALRRSWQKEDETRAEDRTIRAEDRAEQRGEREFERESTMKVGLLQLAQQHKREEWETEQQYEERLLRIKGDIDSEQIAQRGAEDRRTVAEKASFDQKLEGYKFANDRELAEIKDGYAKGEVDRTEVADDGSLIIVYEDGRTVRKGVKIRESASGFGSGTSLADMDAPDETPKEKPTRAGGLLGREAPPTRRERPAEPAMPTAQEVAAAQRFVDQQMKAGQLPPGNADGDLAELPAGAGATFPITAKWSARAKRWEIQNRARRETR